MLTGLQLRRALLKYGQHTWLCATRRATKDDVCTCGFENIHAELTEFFKCKVCGTSNRYHNNECVECVRRRMRANRQREKAACT